MSSNQEVTVEINAERQTSSSEEQNCVSPQKETKKRKNSKSLEVLFGCFGLRRFKFLRLSSFKKTHDSTSCSSSGHNSRVVPGQHNRDRDQYDVIACDVVEDLDTIRRSGSESVAACAKSKHNYQLPTKSHSLHQNMEGAVGSNDVMMMGNGAVAGGTDGQWQPLFDEWTFNRETWRVKSRFQSLKAVNGGAFGFVCSAVDTLTNTEVAIKRMNQPFKSEIHAKRALRELKLLRFAQHDNLISLVDAYTTAVSAQSMVDLYLVMPLLDTDLHQLIQQFKQSDQHILSQDYIHFFMYQMLRGLKYLHSANIMHRDLKPSNIAIKTDCSLKIIDFGLCRKANKEVTGYVQTRWYRAPEVMIDWKHYTSADLWSLGCILGEMLLARPVFKEDDHVELLKKHIYICGTPDEQTLQSYESEQAVTFIRERLSGQPRVNFVDYFRGTEPCTDLLERLLQMNPRDRLTAEQALSHPYFSQLHDPVDEKEASGIFDDSFEDIATTPELKQAIFNEVSHIAIHGPHWNGLPEGSRQ